MHGLGPGASVQGAFATILPFLGRHFHVFAMDFIGFGGSGRKPEPPHFDFPLWVRQARQLIARMPATGRYGDGIGIFGHSMSGAITLRLAASEPRVRAGITTGTAGTQFPVNRHLSRLWTAPRSLEDLKLAMRSLIHDADAIPDAVLQDRWRILSADDYADYFDGIFDDKQRLADTWVIGADEIAAIKVPYTLVHGRDDLACPPAETSLRLAEQMPHADVVLLARCAHAPAMEHPAKVAAAVRSAFASLVDFNPVK
jgi:2-hydroxymuconate-semialdehyde hydrolase